MLTREREREREEEVREQGNAGSLSMRRLSSACSGSRGSTQYRISLQSVQGGVDTLENWGRKEERRTKVEGHVRWLTFDRARTIYGSVNVWSRYASMYLSAYVDVRVSAEFSLHAPSLCCLYAPHSWGFQDLALLSLFRQKFFLSLHPLVLVAETL